MMKNSGKNEFKYVKIILSSQKKESTDEKTITLSYCRTLRPLNIYLKIAEHLFKEVVISVNVKFMDRL